MRFIKTKDLKKTEKTGRIGTLEASYDEIIEELGEPCFGESPDNKIRAEWVLQFENGMVATIYDYKEYDIPLEEVTSWSIGGHKAEVADLVTELFE